MAVVSWFSDDSSPLGFTSVKCLWLHLTSSTHGPTEKGYTYATKSKLELLVIAVHHPAVNHFLEIVQTARQHVLDQ
ncbi:hypothetical protein DFS34DRAFT_654848 [Phlyctochytrium arcticum]|nr:hypothetical protein DFS34DRAFT_654848 [Phlyctochytrium arcticum]